MKPGRAWALVFWLSVGLSGLFLAAHAGGGPLHNLQFCADNLYLPTLFADITRWNGRLADWRLTPAPYFFPDMLAYAVVRSIAPSLEAAQYGTAWIQMVAILLSARALVARVMPDRPAASALVGPWLLCLFLTYHFGAADVVSPALVISSHGGALVCTLIVFTLCVRSHHPARFAGWMAVGLVSALAGASDALFVVECSAVLAIVAVVYGFAYRHALRTAPVSVGRCALGAACGAAAWAAARAVGLVGVEATAGNFELALENASALVHVEDTLLRSTYLGLLLVSVIAAAVAFASAAAELAGLRLLAFLQIAVTFTLFGALLYTGEHRTPRYFIIPLSLAAVFGAALHARWIGSAELANPWPRRTAVAMTITTVIGLATTSATIVRGDYVAPLRAAASCVERIAKREGVTVIVAGYWFAKPLMLFSDKRAHVIQVQTNLEPYFWINSRSWYRGARHHGILITNGLDPHGAMRILGQPQVVEHCGDLELYVYRGEARERMTNMLDRVFHTALADPL